jgi:predicted 2-oxoglutarate/Fe(II)-dependent dioxygenase YbiX
MDVQTYGKRVATLDGVLTVAECRALLGAAARVGYEAAPITTPFGFVMRPDIRNNTRAMLDDPKRATWLWDRVAAEVKVSTPDSVGVNERLRFYRYETGQYFRWHTDGSFQRDAHTWSVLTLLLYLDADYEGGRTEIAGIGPIEPRPGRALLFPHGLRHRGAPVTDGTKHVMRTDVMVRSDHA